MKKYYAFYTVSDGGEKFYFENGKEATVVVMAETDEEARDRFLQCIDNDYMSEAKEQLIEEFDSPEDFSFYIFVEWDINKFPNYESAVMYRPE